MLERSYGEAFLSLFTSPDRAVAIIGDLREESPRRSAAWHLLKISSVALALCRERARSVPLRYSALATLGLGTYATVWSVLFVASGLPWYPWHRVNEPAFWIRLALVVVIANLLTGFILGRWVSIRGTNAVAPVVFFWLIAFPVETVLAKLMFPGLPLGELVLFACGFPLCAVLPLIVGGILARRRAMTPGARAA
jgi:hypothetical protein